MATGNLAKSFSEVNVPNSTKIHIIQGTAITYNKSQKYQRYAKLLEEVHEKENGRNDKRSQKWLASVN